MPDFPIIDSHIHLVDRSLPYGWISRLPPALRAGRTMADFRVAAGGVAVERVVTVEFLVDDGHHLEEAERAAEIAAANRLVSAFVASAPVERGAAVEAEIEALSRLPLVRGIRRIIPADRFAMAVDPDFIEGVRRVGAFGLPFEIGVDFAGLPFALDLARRCPDVTFVLDHLGTPPIRDAVEAPWRDLMRDFAALPNVRAKLSGLMAGIVAGAWTAEAVADHLRHALDCFGPARVMYGSDWPVHTVALPYAGWVAIVDRALLGLGEADRRSVYRDVAIRTYRLDEGSTT